MPITPPTSDMLFSTKGTIVRALMRDKTTFYVCVYLVRGKMKYSKAFPHTAAARKSFRTAQRIYPAVKLLYILKVTPK